MIINYLDALAGWGKTEYIIRETVALAGRGEKSVITVPTVVLCEKVKDRIATKVNTLPNSIRPRIQTIHHENCAGSVVGAIISHINEPKKEEGEILILTMAAYDCMPWKNFRPWTESRYLFGDEIPAVTQCYDVNLPETHDIITKHMTTCIDPALPGYSLVAATEEAIEKIKSMARNRNQDKVWDIFQPLAHVLQSRHWKNYVQDEHHDRLLNGKSTRLQVHSIRQPSTFGFGWKKVTIGGALFEDSLLYQVWKGMGVQFIQEISGPKQHTNGELLNLYWGIEGRMTKYKHDKMQGNEGDDKFIKAVCDKTAKTMGVANTNIVVLTNKNMDEDQFKEATRLPASPYGVDDFKSYRYFVATGAYNHCPAHLKFLKEATGLDAYKIWRGTHFYMVYQGLVRSALRNPDNKEEVHAATVDQQTTWNLKALFPGCKVKRIAGLEQYALRGRTNPNG